MFICPFCNCETDGDDYHHSVSAGMIYCIKDRIVPKVNLSKCTCNTTHRHAAWCPFCIEVMVRTALSMGKGERVELNDYPDVTRSAGYDAPLIRR